MQPFKIVLSVFALMSMMACGAGMPEQDQTAPAAAQPAAVQTGTEQNELYAYCVPDGGYYGSGSPCCSGFYDGHYMCVSPNAEP